MAPPRTLPPGRAARARGPRSGRSPGRAWHPGAFHGLLQALSGQQVSRNRARLPPSAEHPDVASCVTKARHHQAPQRSGASRDQSLRCLHFAILLRFGCRLVPDHSRHQLPTTLGRLPWSGCGGRCSGTSLSLTSPFSKHFFCPVVCCLGRAATMHAAGTPLEHSECSGSADSPAHPRRGPLVCFGRGERWVSGGGTGA
jgi:hypothetical protein